MSTSPLRSPAFGQGIVVFRFRRAARRHITAIALVAAAAGAMAAFAAAAVPPSSAPAGRAATSRPSPAASAPAANAAASDDHFEKAKALFDDKKYAEAMQEVDLSIRANPNNGDAQVLKRVLAARLADQAGGTTTGPAGVAAGPAKMLTTQQVSIIRLMEAANGDAMRGSVPRKALDDFWQTVWSKSPNADLSTAAYNNFLQPGNFPLQAERIRASGNQKFIEQVNVTSDPASMIAYSNSVSPFVLQNCATADCHGGNKGGNFRLLPTASTPDARYTNFYLLNSYSSTAGQMLDRNTPDNSLLLQYALPRATAKSAHPKVETRKINDVNSPTYQRISAWIRSLNVPAPNYGFTFAIAGTTLPSVPGTATGPATGTRPK